MYVYTSLGWFVGLMRYFFCKRGTQYGENDCGVRFPHRPLPYGSKPVANNIVSISSAAVYTGSRMLYLKLLPRT